jgi:hypothetical protein
MSTKSITFQTADSVIASGDVLGSINFAASNEADGSASTLITAKVIAMAEGVFNTTRNPSSLNFYTAEADASEARLIIKMNDDGHLTPQIAGDVQNLGTSGELWSRGYLASGLYLKNLVPSDTNQVLYNNAGSLYFNGAEVGGGGGSSNPATSGIIIENTTYILDPAGSGEISELTIGKALKTALVEDADGATITFDMDECNYHRVTVSGNRTLAVTNVDVGQKFTLRIQQGDPGNYEPTWFGKISWPGDLVPTFTDTASGIDTFGFICTSGGYYDGFVIGYNLTPF